MIYQGAKIDDRKIEDKKKDYSYLEIASAPVPTWLTKEEASKTETLYPKRNQLSTSSCGAHGGELALSIDTNTLHEQAFIYHYRINFPSEGMHHWDIGNILRDRRACEYLGIQKTEQAYNTYTPTPSQIINASSFTKTDFIILENDKFTIDDIAHILNDLKRPVMLHVYWSGTEWSSKKPLCTENIDLSSAKYHHFIVGLPNSAYIENGQKFFIIQDSAWFGGFNIRHISEDWINRRTYAGIYRLPLTTEKGTISFSYVFNKDLDVGSTGDDVRKLQQALKELGYFPNITPTGYFGGITRQAVKDFQKAYFNQILQAVGLSKPTGYFGASTRRQLNKLMK